MRTGNFTAPFDCEVWEYRAMLEGGQTKSVKFDLIRLNKGDVVVPIWGKNQRLKGVKIFRYLKTARSR